jgi:hypothetical protein
MWLHVPSESLRFAPEPEHSISDSGSPNHEPELWCTLSGIPTQRPRSWRGWKTRPWTTRLFGMISQPSTAARGVEQWIALSQASHASRSASLENAGVQTMNGGSGPTSPEAFARWDQSSCSWRMSQGSLFEASTPYLGTWPAWGSMRNGACSQQRPPALPISASGYSYWPTPTTRDYKDDGSAEANVPTNGLLGRTVARWRMWPTPDANVMNDAESPETVEARRQREKARHRNGNGMGTPLAMAARMWSTPTAQDGRRPATDRTSRDRNLARDVEAFGLQPTTTTRDGEPTSMPVVLNPLFVEELMGWPRGWSGYEPLGMELSHWLRRWRTELYRLV